MEHADHKCIVGSKLRNGRVIVARQNVTDASSSDGTVRVCDLPRGILSHSKIIISIVVCVKIGANVASRFKQDKYPITD